MLRKLFSELLPNRKKRDAIGELRSDGGEELTALQSLQRRIHMADKPEVRQANASDARSNKADPDRKDTTGEPQAPKPRDAPVRDVRENPAANPNGEPKEKTSPRPTEKPSADA